MGDYSHSSFIVTPTFPLRKITEQYPYSRRSKNASRFQQLLIVLLVPHQVRTAM